MGMKAKYHDVAVLKLLSLIFQRKQYILESSISVGEIYNMIVGHSKFLDVILNNKASPVKGKFQSFFFLFY